MSFKNIFCIALENAFYIKAYDSTRVRLNKTITNCSCSGGTSSVLPFRENKMQENTGKYVKIFLKTENNTFGVCSSLQEQVFLS